MWPTPARVEDLIQSRVEGCAALRRSCVAIHINACRGAVAEGNVLIYSTHLPFMIDLRQPARIHVMSETTQGNAVSDDLTQSQPEGKLVLQAALGMSGSASYLVAERNLVVEGVDDYWIVSELSNLLIRSGEAGLPDDVLITPAGGASEAGYIATFMIGQDLKVVVLLDTTAREKTLATAS